LVDTANGNVALPGLSLFDCLRNWDWLTWRVRPQAVARVINYFPRYPKDPKSAAYSDYCRVKLMLHHPFVDWADLLLVDGQAYGSYIDAFRACSLLHSHPEDFYTDPDNGDGDTDSDTETEDELDPEDGSDTNYPLADFEALARRRPKEDFTLMGLGQDVGTREIDRVYDWSIHVGRYNIHPGIWDQIKAENPVAQVVSMDSSPDSLNLEQRKLYDTVVSQYLNELGGQSPPQLLLYVDGVAGSGKTFVLLKTCARIQELAQQDGKPNPVFRAAPTGIVAFNIIKRTLHALLRLPVKGKKSDLSIATL
jgi:ATP-dependent DNA helicase PIF1